MKPCDRALAQSIYRDSSIRNVRGVPVHIKRIPDSDRTGILDEREYVIRKAIWDYRKLLPQTVDLETIRKTTRTYTVSLNDRIIPEEKFLLQAGEREVPVYRYDGRACCDKNEGFRDPVPAFIFIHGGSFMTGDAVFYKDVCTYIAEKAGCMVFNISYSLAPEHPYPAAVEECMALLQYVHQHAEEYGIDSGKISVGGDSAGANLAIASALNCPDTHRPCYLALFYPCVDLWAQDDLYEWKEEDFEIDDSERELILSRLTLGRSDGKGNNELMMTIFRNYMGGEYDRLKRRPDISPVYADLSCLPRTQIFTAEYDALRIQAEYFAGKLTEYGVENTIFRYRGVTHAFLDYFGVLPQAEAAVLEVVHHLLDSDNIKE